MGFNPFELGQAVIYREPGRTDADKVVEADQGGGAPMRTSTAAGACGTGNGGDVHAADRRPTARRQYYVMAGTNQFNLIGDQRLVDKQVIQLGALENETRGGIARVKLGPVHPGASGFTSVRRRSSTRPS